MRSGMLSRGNFQIGVVVQQRPTSGFAAACIHNRSVVDRSVSFMENVRSSRLG